MGSSGGDSAAEMGSEYVPLSRFQNSAGLAEAAGGGTSSSPAT